MPPENGCPNADEVKSDQNNGTVALRDTVVSTAVHFLQNPNVRETPMSQKRAFLLKKGLTNEEIDHAFDKASMVSQKEHQPMQKSSHITDTPSIPPSHAPSFWSSLNGIASSVVILGVVCYGAYQLYKSYIKQMFVQGKQKEDRLTQMELQLIELNRSLSQLRRSLSTVETTVTAQKCQLNKLCDPESMANSEVLPTPILLNDIKSEITSLKSLLLNRSQFPAAPSIPTIPFWQLPDNVSNEKMKDDKSNEPLNEQEETNKNVSLCPDSLNNVCVKEVIVDESNTDKICPAVLSEEKN